MPVHAHHGTERLEPEWMRQAAQQFIAPVMVDDRLANHCAEPRHPIGQPFRDVAAVQWKIGAAGSKSHQPGRPTVRGCGRDRAVLIAVNMASLSPSGNAPRVRRDVLPIRSMGR
jgi:hypothetical protein